MKTDKPTPPAIAAGRIPYKRPWASVLAAALFLYGFISHGAAEAEKPRLWNLAVSAFSSAREFVPGRLHIISQELNSKGAVKHSKEKTIRIFFDSCGVQQSEVLYAREKGQDTTVKERQRNADAKGSSRTRSLRLGGEELPFALSRQKQLVVSEENESDLINGIECKRFSFTMKLPAEENEGKAMSLKGRAWIDPVGLYPVKVELAPDPLPGKVKSLQTGYTFQKLENGACVVKELIVEGSGGVLFIRKYFRTTISFGNYFPKPIQTNAPPSSVD